MTPSDPSMTEGNVIPASLIQIKEVTVDSFCVTCLFIQRAGMRPRSASDASTCFLVENEKLR